MRFYLRLLIAVFAFLVLNVNGQSTKKKVYAVLLDNTLTLQANLQNVKALGSGVGSKVASAGSLCYFIFATASDGFAQAAELGACDVPPDEARKLIESVDVVKGQTRLYDAVVTVVQAAKAKAASDPTIYHEAEVVLITDGEDRASKRKLDELKKFLVESKTKVNAIGILWGLSDDGGYIGPSPRAKAKKALEEISKASGGKVVFPKAGESIAAVLAVIL